MGPATQYWTLTDELALATGGELSNITLAWESWGTLNSERANAILVLTGLSASAHAASSDQDPAPGWWEGVIGPGCALDTDHYFVICINPLGSCLGSTGPASLHPITNKPWRLDFPEITMEDIAHAAHGLIAHLGIDQLHALVGPSMGGMTALAYLKRHPHSVQQLVLISTTAASSPFALAIRALQREAIVSDPNFHDGQYTDEQLPASGMQIARKLGMISYRSAEEWASRFGRETQDAFPPQPFRMRYAVEAYLEAAAQKFAQEFDPCSYLYLSRAMDSFDAADQDDSLADFFKRSFSGRALILGVTTDLLFPPSDQQRVSEAIAAAGQAVNFEILDSDKGHDAFLVDSSLFEAQIRSWLK